jgi:hypothetical protein
MRSPLSADICRGPVVDGVCEWCGARYVKEYDQRCAIVRSNRERRDIAVKTQPFQGLMILIECWNCDARTVLDSLTNKQHVDDLMTGGTLFAVCPQCGAGSNAYKSNVIDAKNARLQP